MSDFTVHVDISGDVGRLRWALQEVDAQTLSEAISLAADDAILAHGLRRIQVDLLATDVPARRAVQRAGFRQEGRLRQAREAAPGRYVDVLVYARLASDTVYGPVGFSSVMDSVLPTKRVIAHVVFRDPAGRVLLVEPTYKEDWELPGGVVDRGESPRDGARREVREETGLDVDLGAPALTDWMPPSLGWSDAVEFIFDGGTLPEAVARSLVACDAELVALHWVDPPEVPDRMSELGARRVELVLAGRGGMTEDGRLVG